MARRINYFGFDVADLKGISISEFHVKSIVLEESIGKIVKLEKGMRKNWVTGR